MKDYQLFQKILHELVDAGAWEFGKRLDGLYWYQIPSLANLNTWEVSYTIQDMYDLGLINTKTIPNIAYDTPAYTKITVTGFGLDSIAR